MRNPQVHTVMGLCREAKRWDRLLEGLGGLLTCLQQLDAQLAVALLLLMLAQDGQAAALLSRPHAAAAATQLLQVAGCHGMLGARAGWMSEMQQLTATSVMQWRNVSMYVGTGLDWQLLESGCLQLLPNVIQARGQTKLDCPDMLGVQVCAHMSCCS